MSGLARQFLGMAGVAILAYLLLAHYTGAEGILQSATSGGSQVISTLQGRST